MAFAIVADTNTSLEDASNVTSHTVNLPPNISNGDLLIVVFARDGSGAITFPGGDWTIINGQSSGGAVAWQVQFRNADGGEGATIIVVTAQSERSAHLAYRITGHDSSRAPDAASSQDLATSDSPDPLNNDQGGGAEDYLWIVSEANDRDRTIDGNFPTNYDSNQLDSRGSGANSCGVAGATRNLNASSENAGAFTLSASDQWLSSLVAVHPALVAAGGHPFYPGNINPALRAALVR